MQQRGPQNLIFTAFSHLIMASGVGEEEIKVDSSANFFAVHVLHTIKFLCNAHSANGLWIT